MKYQLVIFDLDGTILYTLEDLTNATNVALRKNELPERTMAEVRSMVGNGIPKLIERAVPAGTDDVIRDKVYSDFNEYYRVHCADNTRPYEGINELFTMLRDNGVLIAIVSNKADYGVQSLCKEYFPDMYDMAVGAREGIRKKPYPDSTLEVIRVLGVSKEKCVYIGDSEVDIETAHNAEIDCISVTWGYKDEDFLINRGAKVLAHDCEELREALLLDSDSRK